MQPAAPHIVVATKMAHGNRPESQCRGQQDSSAAETAKIAPECESVRTTPLSMTSSRGLGPQRPKHTQPEPEHLCESVPCLPSIASSHYGTCLLQVPCWTV